MNQFFTQLAESLKDRQELRMSIKKIGEDLVVTVTPDFKEGTKNIEMSGTPSEIDENFISELKKPLSVEKAFSSNADEVKKELEEEEEDDDKSSDDKKKEAKKPIKKATPKKQDKKKEVKAEANTEEVKAPEQEEQPVANAEADHKKAEADKKKQFQELMVEGKRLFNDRQYKEAEASFQAAVDMFPADEAAIKQLSNATKWVKAIENLNNKD